MCRLLFECLTLLGLCCAAARPLTADDATALQPLTAKIPSTVDGVEQTVRYFIPDGLSEPAPLVVLLHSWSGNVNQNTFLPDCMADCQRRGWVVIHPDFRGANVRPEACASDLAVQDVVDAVEWIATQASIDPRRRYVTGASGGGHMTLMMAGRHPHLWAAASAWVPISDIAAWHPESVARGGNYARHLEAVCGGPPGTSAAVDLEYRHRSPLTHLPQAKGLPIDINAGITDGHNGSVPISHSLHAFNLLAEVNEQPDVKFTADLIEDMTRLQQLPETPVDALWAMEHRQRAVLLRRIAGPARVTIFDGGHEGDVLAAMEWLGQFQSPEQP